MKTMKLTAYVIAWVVLGVATLGLALYRMFLAMKEDDFLHIEGWQAPQVARQASMARKMGVIDRWGEALTVLTAVAGLLSAGVYLYGAWLQSL